MPDLVVVPLRAASILLRRPVKQTNKDLAVSREALQSSISPIVPLQPSHAAEDENDSDSNNRKTHPPQHLMPRTSPDSTHSASRTQRTHEVRPLRRVAPAAEGAVREGAELPSLVRGERWGVK